jgi:hypothetical protein
VGGIGRFVMPAARTANIRVICRRDGFANTLQRLAWTVGHRVSFEPTQRDPDTSVAIIFTDFDYRLRNRILDDRGLDVIGKIDGVLRWEVVSNAGVMPGDVGSMDDHLRSALARPDVGLELTRDRAGGVGWTWLGRSGREATIPAAIGAALDHALGAWVARAEETMKPNESVADALATAFAELARSSRATNAMYAGPSADLQSHDS